MDSLTAIFCFVITAITFFYLFIKYKLTYWDRQGVINTKPKSLSNVFSNFAGKHNSYWTEECYQVAKGKAPFGGVYFLWNPLVVIVDLDLVKNILIRDFTIFHDRGMFFNERDDPLTAHLFNIEGQKWRTLRSKLSPTFTSGKMKFMYSTVVDVSEKFVETLNDIVKTDSELEVKDLLGRFTTDIIGSCAFGIECNSLNDPNAQFRQMGRKLFEEPRGWRAFKQAFALSFRDLAVKCRVKFIPTDASEFFMGIVSETIQFRKENNVERNDFMKLLMELQEGIEGLTFEQVAAQAFVFFLAGFETSSTTLTFCLYKLAQHPEVQTKARVEIEKVLEKYNGKLTYEAMMDMVYIEQILNETLRMFPPVANVFRKANTDYEIPDSKLLIKKNSSVWIPVYAIHHDPEFYPNPQVFNPDRFEPEAMKQRHPMTFLPFGDGPRNCIGLRFGMMQSRIGLIQLLRNFKIDVGKHTTIPVKFAKNSFILTPSEGMWLKIERL